MKRITLNDVEDWIQNAMQKFPKHYKTDDWIVTLLVDGKQINELLLFDEVDSFGYLDYTCSYVWRNDWFEGQKNINLIALCPISLIENHMFVEYE